MTHTARTKAFFMKHGLITLSPKGNVKLASGQGFYFLETKEKQSANFVTHDWDDNNAEHEMESICFEVYDVSDLHRRTKENGANVSELKGSDGCGGAFHFYDPDSNKYTAWEDV